MPAPGCSSGAMAEPHAEHGRINRLRQVGRRVLAVGVPAGLAIALATAAQAQLLTPTPPPELWDTPAGDQLDQHAPEDLGEKYDLDAELSTGTSGLNNLVGTFV